MKPNFMPSTISNGKRTRYPKSGNSIVMIGNDTDEASKNFLIHF